MEDFLLHAPELFDLDRGSSKSFDDDRSHLCNQWLSVRTAPAEKSEIFYLSILSLNRSLRQQGFSFGRVSYTQIGTVVFPRRVTGFECDLLHLRACLCVRVFIQAVTGESSDIKGVESQAPAVGPARDLRVVFLKELPHWHHQALSFSSDQS